MLPARNPARDASGRRRLQASSARLHERIVRPVISSAGQARQIARAIAGWKPLPLQPVKRIPQAPRLRRTL